MSRDGEIMNSDLTRLEQLYNCNFYKMQRGEQKFLELHTLHTLTMNNLVHIAHILKQSGYYFYKVEACDDYLMITYYKK